MHRRILTLLLALIASAASLRSAPTQNQTPAIQFKLQTPAVTFFPISQVRLLDGPFKRRYDTNTRYLLDILDPDRLLAPFRVTAGLPPRAAFYGGWEARGHGASGHTLGHYLTALSFLQASTDDPKVRDEARRRIDYIVDELIACRRAKGSGAIMPVSKRVEFPLDNIRVPFYNLHKLLAGLRDAYELAGNKNALVLSRSIADWLDTLLRPLSHKQIQTMLSREYGGMNEVLADLAAGTSDPRYLRMASAYFHRDYVLNPMFKGEDRLGALHANTQIPIVVGLAREYELTGDPRYRTAATSFWSHVVNDRTYAIGGHSESEHFFPPDEFPERLTSRTCETCNVNNMLKLTRHLFEWAPDAAQMDFVERALVNQLASAIGENPGEFCYFFPLGSVAVKGYSRPTDAFWCCVGTGMENPAKYGEQIYARDASAVWINQYIASTLDWPEERLRVTMETQFPDSDTVRIRITITDSKPRRFTLKLRHPCWCAAPGIKINDQPVKENSTPSSYIAFDREWKDGDTIELRLPMTLHSEPLPHSDNKIISLLYGPAVLAAVIPDTASPGKQRFSSQLDTRGKTDAPPPLIVASNTADALSHLHPIPDCFAEFRADALFKPSAFPGAAERSEVASSAPSYATLTLIPLHHVYEQPYAVYFPILTPAEWPTRDAQIHADLLAQQKLAAATLATVAPGDAKSESQHALRKENSQPAEAFDRQSRVARDNGWFSYDMAVSPDAPVTLIATYWGGIWDERNFDISIDGRRLATQRLYNDSPGDFIDIPYPIPPEWTRGKTKVTVRFTGRPKTAELFNLRTVRTDAVQKIKNPRPKGQGI